MVKVEEVFNSHTSGKSPSRDTPTIVFLSGFPDSSDSWNRLAPQFEKTHHVITLAMPDYESKYLRQFMGYSMTEIVNGLAAVIEPHFKSGSSIHLVGHDWGAAVCMMYSQAYTKTITKLVLLDIGERKTFCWRSMSYMLFLSWVFLVSRVSDFFALLCVALYPWGLLGPCPNEMGGKGLEVPHHKGFKAFMCYPYFNFFRQLVGQVLGGKSAREIGKAMSLPLKKGNNTLPTLFLFGEKKRFMFHDESFLHKLEACGGKWKSFPKSGHWIHWQEPEAVGAEIKSFLL